MKKKKLVPQHKKNPPTKFIKKKEVTMDSEKESAQLGPIDTSTITEETDSLLNYKFV